MTDREIVLFLRQFCRVGHTEGRPLESMTFSLSSGRSYDLYTYNEIKELLDEIMLKISLDCLSATDRFVVRWLKDNNVLQAFIALSEQGVES